VRELDNFIATKYSPLRNRCKAEFIKPGHATTDIGDAEKDMKRSQEIVEPFQESPRADMRVKPAIPGHFSEFGRESGAARPG
jgi:hypothetical protein